MTWNESEILAARRKIFDAAQDMLAGNLSYILGSRRIVALHLAAKLDPLDTDILPFKGIDSATDALPLDETKVHWQAAALLVLLPEIEKSEAWAREFGEPHCRKLVERYRFGELDGDIF